MTKTATIEITATRNGKPITMIVDVKYRKKCDPWVLREGGKKLYGTTGYYCGGTIRTYGRKILLENVKGIEAIEEYCKG